MTPIGIVTRNRHHVLDLTLRSLSASDLPDDQAVVIFDDASDRKTTLDYLYSDKVVPVGVNFPRSDHWRRQIGDLGHKQRGSGIASKIEVVKIAKEPQGVVNATCMAFSYLASKYGSEHGIIIVQDDVVFNQDWLTRILAAEQDPEEGGRSIGLIAGCWINKKNPTKRSPMTRVDSGGITAQCYYVTPAGVKASLPWTKKRHAISKGFDNKFCANIRQTTDVYRMHPAVCQHIGVQSLVRPKWTWHRWTKKGRVDFSSRPPFPLAQYVARFKET